MNLFETLWANHYAQKLTAHELNQFRRAEARGPSLLLTDVIQKESYDHGARRYTRRHLDSDGRGGFLRQQVGDDL